jgi:hypothetical protein
MRYRSRNDGAQFSSDAAAFVNLLGQREYLQLLQNLGAGLNHKGYVTEIDDLRFSLELQLLNLELLAYKMRASFPACRDTFTRRLTLSSGSARPYRTCPKERVWSFGVSS